MEDSKKNLEIVVDGFINTVCNGRAYDRALEFMHPDFVKHYHDGSPDGNAEKFIEDYKGLVSQFPEIRSEVKKSIAKGDEVWLWTSIGGLPEGYQYQIVEICRVQDGKVREKWDIHQQGTGKAQ